MALSAFRQNCQASTITTLRITYVYCRSAVWQFFEGKFANETNIFLNILALFLHLPDVVLASL